MHIHTGLEQRLRDLRHTLHHHPELSHEEHATTALLQTRLQEAGITLLDYGLPTGLVAEIRGQQPGPTIVLRADIDALPIQEETELAFKSATPGVMHACGHDFHAAALFGAALLLQQEQATLAGNVRLLFQPAEETGLGAPDIIAAGVLDGASAIFGLHNDPNLPVGTLASRHGTLTASVDRFEILIHGKGSHAARPHEGKDPAIILAQLILGAQSIISRNVSCEQSAIVSVTHVHSGNTWNVIPDTAYLEGTVRTLDAGTRQLIEQRLRQLIAGTALAYDVTIDLEWHPGPPSVTNDAAWTDHALALAGQLGFDARVIDKPWLGGEDFAFYQHHIPGAFVLVGSGGPYALHHPKFRVDDNALLPAANFLAELALSSLGLLRAR